MLTIISDSFLTATRHRSAPQIAARIQEDKMIDPIVYRAEKIAQSRMPAPRWPWIGKRWRNSKPVT